MMPAVKLHPFIYNLLIQNEFDLFNIVSLRDALMGIAPVFTDSNEARKFIYRQLLRLENLGFVRKTINPGGAKNIYKKTEKFYNTTFSPRKMTKHTAMRSNRNHTNENPRNEDLFLINLVQERITHETSLSLVINEIKEYKSLMFRFPNKK
jgi:hypothetical protein